MNIFSIANLSLGIGVVLCSASFHREFAAFFLESNTFANLIFLATFCSANMQIKSQSY